MNLLIKFTIFLFAFNCHIAMAQSNSENQNLYSSLITRRTQLEKYTLELSKGAKANSKSTQVLIDKMHALDFCTHAEPRNAPEYWKKIIEIYQQAYGQELNNGHSYYRSLTNVFAQTIVSCSHSQAAYRNAAFYLDYMYWNRILDLTGLEIADSLLIRDVFYEAYSVGMASEIVKLQLKAEEDSNRGQTIEITNLDFLTKGPMSSSKVLKYFGLLLNFSDSAKQAVIEAITAVLNLREKSIVIYGDQILKIINDKSDLKLMNEFYSYLETIRQNHKILGVKHAGWAKLMELSNHNKQQVYRVIGVLASMRFWELDEVARSLAVRGKLTVPVLRAFLQGTMSYFLMNQFDERSALDSSDGHSVEFHFFYPPGHTSKDWKIYHWFANAYLGCRLKEMGHSETLIAYGAKSLAQSYEYVTLNLAYVARSAMNVDPRAMSIIEGYKDVQINTEGAIYGARCFQ